MIFIGLGANLAFEGRSPIQNMENALGRLNSQPDVDLVSHSPWYRTAPVGKLDQPNYFNGVACLETSLAPFGLMKRLLDVERRTGRVRNERWGPRTLDLDLLDFEGEILDIERDGVTLHLPHPRLHERAFVLYPMMDVAPDWKHPALQRTAADLLSDIGPGQAIERIDKPETG